MPRDHAGPVVFAAAVDVLHVGPHFRDIEPTVAIERNRDGLADIGLRQHEFQLVTVGQLDGLRLICRREGGGHGLRRKALVRLGGGRAGHAGRDQR